MQRLIVESDVIRSVGYQATTGTLEIELNDGGVYRYIGVPAPTYLALMNAESKGEYFNKEVKDVFPYRKVESRLS